MEVIEHVEFAIVSGYLLCKENQNEVHFDSFGLLEE